MLNDLLIWCALLGVLVLALGRGPNGVLTLSYFVALSVAHIPGVLAYIGPSPYPFYAEATIKGLDLTVAGMAAYVGTVVVLRLVGRRRGGQRVNHSLAELERFAGLGTRFLVFGAAAYFVILPVVKFIPSATSIIASFGSLLLTAFWLKLYVGFKERSMPRLMGTFALLPLLPLSTLVAGGFLGYGTIWLATVVVFMFSAARKRTWFYIVAAPAIYLGLSLFVTYMDHRSELREVIWSDSSLLTRLASTKELITDFQLLDLENEEHEKALAGRLNQNFLVGLAAERQEDGEYALYRGATVPLWALIPRAIWPDKPPVGGSGSIASDVTGLHFAEGTSVGIGQVAEFYINFGRTGVVVGFVLWALVLMWLDASIRHAFDRLDARLLVSAVLPGLAMIQPIGSLLEILVALVAAFATAGLLRSFGLADIKRLRRPAAPPERRRVA